MDLKLYNTGEKYKVRLILKGMDVTGDCLSAHKPKDLEHFNLYVVLTVGGSNTEDRNLFDLQICSSKWFKSSKNEDISSIPLWKNKMLIVDKFDEFEIKSLIINKLDEIYKLSPDIGIEGQLEKFNSYARWEFDNYIPFLDPETGGDTTENEGALLKIQNVLKNLEESGDIVVTSSSNNLIAERIFEAIGTDVHSLLSDEELDIVLRSLNFLIDDSKMGQREFQKTMGFQKNKLPAIHHKLQPQKCPICALGVLSGESSFMFPALPGWHQYHSFAGEVHSECLKKHPNSQDIRNELSSIYKDYYNHESEQPIVLETGLILVQRDTDNFWTFHNLHDFVTFFIHRDRVDHVKNMKNGDVCTFGMFNNIELQVSDQGELTIEEKAVGQAPLRKNPMPSLTLSRLKEILMELESL